MHKFGIATAVAVLLVMMAISGSLASDDQDQALVQAASQNDLQQVRELLAKRANVNARSEQGWTALMQAAANGRLEIVKLLLDKGADVNAKDYEGTALIKASSCGHFDVVSLLLKRGADVKATDREGKTALMVVCKEGDKRVERAIVDLLKAPGATAASDGSEQASPEGAIDPNLMATWELLYQTDEQGKNEQKPIQSVRTLIELTDKGMAIFKRIDESASDRAHVRTGKYRTEHDKIILTDDAGSTVIWPYQIADDKLTMVMPEMKKKFYWQRVR